MNREKALLKNTLILAVGRLSSKVFTFFLLPVYTAALLPEDYGTVDVLQTVVSLILYFVTLQLESAVFRHLIECRNKEDEAREYISTSVLVLIWNSCLFSIAIIIVNIFLRIPHIALFILSMWAQGFSYLMLNIARGEGNNILYSISSFVITIVSLVINIFLILGVGIGASSILVAIVVANFIGGSVIFFYDKLWYTFSFRFFSVHKLKEMLSYSIPLIPNAVSWWIANTSDRILILFFLGASASGIYAAANKIPTIYTTFFSVYNLAWSESVALSVKDKDCGEYIDDMMDKSFRIFSFLVLGIISSVSIFFNFLIGANYVEAYNHMFILLIAIFVNSLCTLYGGIFSGFKDSIVIGKTTIVGAAVNFIINITFIRFIGLYAASLSTLASYIVIFIMRKITIKKYVKIKIFSKNIISSLIALIVVSIGYFLRISWMNIIILCMLIIWGFYNNKKDILLLVRGRYYDQKTKKES